MLLVLLILALLIAAIGALLWLQGVSLGVFGSLYFGLYAMLAIILLAAGGFAAADWCQRGRTKRAASGNEPSDLDAVV